MFSRPGATRASAPARHERPDIDEAALVAARAADRLLAVARERSDRWAEYFARVPDQLRDDEIRDLRATATRVRAAYGPKDSVRDTLPESVTEPLLESIDRLLRIITRREATTGI
jgi:hypothetical protein